MKKGMLWWMVALLVLTGCTSPQTLEPSATERFPTQTLQTYPLIDSQKEGDLQGLLITVRKAWQYSPGESQQLQDAINAWLKERGQRADERLEDMKGGSFLVFEIEVENVSRGGTPTFFPYFTLGSESGLLGNSTIDVLLYLPVTLSGTTPWWLELAAQRLAEAPPEKQDRILFELGRVEYHQFSLIAFPLAQGKPLRFRMAWQIPPGQKGVVLSYTETGFRDRVAIPIGDPLF
ncbi:MAG: hypothetical protein NTV33_03670 [Coprothermobacterota bacterium]|jgi:hypothetical protein|nr:hypothetical protein [Coprothermobacterota bacterium]